MATGIRTILYPVTDLDAARASFTRLLGTEPTSDSPYYVGFTIDGQEIGLAPKDPTQADTGVVPYVHVSDIDAALAQFVADGGSVSRPVTAVGPGRRIAVATDRDGNVVGMLQDA
jgi:predicted enzyme related to lactoylglutathione lyase